jgi:hypothetical protein
MVTIMTSDDQDSSNMHMHNADLLERAKGTYYKNLVLLILKVLADYTINSPLPN